MKRIERFAIPNLCPELRADMNGDDQSRHCRVCDKQVHNLSALSERQIEKLWRKTGGNLCGYFVPDGSGESSWRRAVAVAALSSSLAIVPVAAQAPASSELVQIGSTTLKGTVVDMSGAAIAGAVVELKELASGREFSAKTDEAGRYSWVGLTSGEYRREISSAGFRAEVSAVSLKSGRVSDSRSTLGVGAGMIGGVIVEVASGALVDTRPASLRGKVMDSSEYGIAFATVEAHNRSTGEVVSTTSGPDGRYEFPSLLRGSYHFVVRAPHLMQVEFPVLSVSNPGPKFLNLTMQVAK